MPQRGRKNADQLLLMALACGATVEAAARSAGVSQATVYRRLLELAFCRKLEQTKADMVQRTSGALTAAGSEAVRALLELLRGAKAEAVRLGAARSVLELGMKVREREDLEKRLTALEQQAETNKR
jgi:hypothetical protein